MAHVLVEWRLEKETPGPSIYADILRWFADDEDGIYSLHRITQAGVKYGKDIAQWYGPSTIDLVLQYV